MIFLDIELEPDHEAQVALENYSRMKSFVKEKGELYCLPQGDPLDETSKQQIREVFQSDYEWSQKVSFPSLYNTLTLHSHFTLYSSLFRDQYRLIHLLASPLVDLSLNSMKRLHQRRVKISSAS